MDNDMAQRLVRAVQGEEDARRALMTASRQGGAIMAASAFLEASRRLRTVLADAALAESADVEEALR